MKLLLLRAAALALCMALSHTAFSQSAPAAAVEQPAQPTPEEWREDLAFMVAEMKRRHPNLYHSVSREKFEAAVADLHAQIPDMQRNEVVVGLMRLAAMIGDGHTRVDPRKDPKFGFPSFPIKLYLFEDGLFVRAARPDHAELIGAQVTAIDGVPVAEVIRRVRAIVSADNEMGYKKFVPVYLNMPDILHALKVSPSREQTELTLRNDRRTWTSTISAGQLDPLWPADTDVSLVTPEGWSDARSAPQPLWLQDPLDHHRMVPLPERGALYARLTMITGVQGQSLTEFGEKIRRQAEAMNPGAVIFDLRLAHGGNHDLRFGLVRELIRSEDEDTRLFVLTGRGTYSASEALLVDLDRLSEGTLVGEPAASKPNSYGDAYRTPLPNSGISIRTSIQFNQLEGQSDDPWTWVDISTPYRFADYRAGRDPVLEVALKREQVTRLYDVLLATSSPAEMRRALDAFTKDPKNRYANHQLQMLIAAERLAGAKRLSEALIVAESAVKRFPRSADAHLVHAFVAEQAGKLDVAAAAARRGLAIDPNHRFGRSLLQRVEGKLAGERGTP